VIRLALVCLVTTCYLAGSAFAGPPPAVDAHAWLVENAATGEVLAAHDATERLPIASITKLMTVLVALEHHRLSDVVDVDPHVTSTGETIGLGAGEQITVHDLVKAALIQSANDAADALALSVAPSYGAFAQLMNAEAHRLGLADSSFVRPDGLDAPDEYSSARDVTRLARVAMRIPVVRETVAERADTIAGGRELHTWNDLLGVFPGLIGVKTGHTSLAGWSQVAAVRGRRVTIYATILGSPSRSQRNDDLERLLAWGLAQYRVVEAISTARTYAQVRLPYGRPPLGLVAAAPQLDVVRVGRAADRARARGRVRLAAGPARAAARHRPGLGGGSPRRQRPARRGAHRAAAGYRQPDTLVCEAHRGPRARLLLMFVTVTLNAAIDRTITVPNFQRGQRHRASAGLPLAGGKGINIARALKTLGVPVVATGLVGGVTGTRIVERLTEEALLNDFVRIEGESRTSTAIVDPTGGTYTEIYEWGPSVKPEELEILLEKLHYLTKAAELVVFAGSLPRDVDDGFYAEAIRDLARRQVASALACEGEPLRLGVEAEPLLVAPSQAEAEALVGQEFHDEEDFELGLERIAELGARNVIVTTEDGCVALLRDGREAVRLRVSAPRVEPISAVGAEDVLLAAFLAARSAGRPPEESLRSAVAAATASTLQLGAARFDPRQVGRFQSGVQISELRRVAV
jgi:1-phosphofructokinase/tagatose 6-phosphate kinase